VTNNLNSAYALEGLDVGGGTYAMLQGERGMLPGDFGGITTFFVGLGSRMGMLVMILREGLEVVVILKVRESVCRRSV
jgi:hypothetical protein